MFVWSLKIHRNIEYTKENIVWRLFWYWILFKNGVYLLINKLVHKFWISSFFTCHDEKQALGHRLQGPVAQSKKFECELGLLERLSEKGGKTSSLKASIKPNKAIKNKHSRILEIDQKKDLKKILQTPKECKLKKIHYTKIKLERQRKHANILCHKNRK